VVAAISATTRHRSVRKFVPHWTESSVGPELQLTTLPQSDPKCSVMAKRWVVGGVGRRRKLTHADLGIDRDRLVVDQDLRDTGHARVEVGGGTSMVASVA
jgi:hypothetical protein